MEKSEFGRIVALESRVKELEGKVRMAFYLLLVLLTPILGMFVVVALR